MSTLLNLPNFSPSGFYLQVTLLTNWSVLYISPLTPLTIVNCLTLISKVEHILSLYPFAEISIFEDFNVHHQLWLSSPFTDHPGELAFNFAILHDLEQLVQHSICILWSPQTLRLLLILLLILLPYLLHWAPPITISYLYLALFLQSFPRIPKTETPLLLLIRETWEGIKLIFPEMITVSCQRPTTVCWAHKKVIMSGMEVYIPHSLSQPTSSKPWFNPTCFRAIHDREVAHKEYLSFCFRYIKSFG